MREILIREFQINSVRITCCDDGSTDQELIFAKQDDTLEKQKCGTLNVIYTQIKIYIYTELLVRSRGLNFCKTEMKDKLILAR